MAGLILLGSLLGCTSDWDPQRRASLPDGGAEIEPAMAGAPKLRRASFAVLPDRGELLAYDRVRTVRHRGAYTSYPIDLSETHAFRATREGGELVVAAPNGELLRFEYDHHVEHADGNWSWIGRAVDGTDAVLTFGESAVFGTIPYGDKESLRVTTSGGQAWLVATDRSKVADINRTGKPDYLIPPSLASLILSGPDFASASEQLESSPAAVTTVDVVLGFTNGYASQLGGASQANTRLNNLIVIANQALANSLITPRLRLVRAVQVNYPDATDNGNALEELTGYRSGSGTTPVPAALQPLRNARDQYGGDLVSLVRAFRAPENDGCGIAWLIGGEQTPIEAADAPFGYSVVSDGNDRDETNNNVYFCREESLAHELGHNMGQAHSIEDSTSAGTHAYSYGYREASSSGFYTVMAYPQGANQFPIRHFANPNVNYSNRPTGVANASDNARSLNLTFPIIAAFRAGVVALGPARGDINGDGRSEIIFRNESLARVGWWEMNGVQVGATRDQSVGQGYVLKALADFNGDGRADMVWANAARRIVMFLSAGTAFTPAVVTNDFGEGWTLQGGGDINGDGKADLIFRHSGAQLVRWWEMSGSQAINTRSQGAGNAYGLSAVGDFNGDGRADIVWSSNARKIVMYLSTGTAFTAVTVTNDFGSGWLLEGAGDINGDGRSDLIFRNAPAQWVGWWEMNGAQPSAYRHQSAGSAYTLKAIGDYNGDGKADLVWASAARAVVMFRSLGPSFSSALVTIDHGVGWSVVDGGP